MQTILGSGGAIGTELAKALKQYTSDLRLVSRNPKKVNDTDILMPADLADASQVRRAIEGSEIVYLTVGFEYSLKVWQEKWPALIGNVIQACIDNKTKLVFFDNVYAIGKDHINHITEDSPISPTSRKGKIRAELDRHILENVKNGKLQALIARSPDFFGPVKTNSMMMITVYDNLVKGKAAQWLCNADAVHSMGYTPDLALGTAMLGNTPDAFGQIWNLPVDPARATGRDWVAMFAKELNASSKVTVLPRWALKALGLFMPIMNELHDMSYQFASDYFFDSQKFNQRFAFTPTTNQEAVKKTIAALKS